MSEIIAFSDDQQAAMLGHAFTTPGVWQQLDSLSFDKQWLSDAELSTLFERCQKFKKDYKRYPLAKELIEAIKDAPAIIRRTNEIVEWCLEQQRHLPLDTLRTKLIEWARSRVLINSVYEIRDKWKSDSHQDAYAAAKKIDTELQKIELLAGCSVDKLELSTVRIKGEAARREEDAIKKIQYGISYLDDALGGIIPSDLIIISARAGAGKTDLAKNIAKSNAESGKRVIFFALEAEQDEIERRIKFTMLASKFRKNNEGNERLAKGTLTYRRWRQNELENLLQPYRKEVELEFEDKYKTLKTYYRQASDFGIGDMEREILKAHKEADLIVIDHLHYVDFDGDDRSENQEMHKLVKNINRLTLSLNIPVVCIAHIRKGNGKTIVPSLDDVHGSSNIVKIARAVIMLAPAHGIVTGDASAGGSSISPTYIRVVKSRLDSNPLHYTATCFYDGELGTYRKPYALGRLNLHETKWTPLKAAPPYWATDASIIDISEAE